MHFSVPELRNRWMRICHAFDEPGLARVVSSGCCYDNIIKTLRELPPRKREKLTREFFEVFPNGKRLGRTAAAVISLDFSKRAPLKQLVEPVSSHLQGLGMESAPVVEVDSEKARDVSMNADWVEAYGGYLHGVRRPGGPMARFLREVVNAAMLSVPRTDVGVLAAWMPRDMVLNLVWEATDGKSSPWDFLVEVVTLGWVPVGLSDDGAFLVSRLNEGGPDRGR